MAQSLITEEKWRANLTGWARWARTAVGTRVEHSAFSHRILGFDGLRAIAVLMVYVTHKTALGRAIGFGGFGVRLFFVLSGFLIVSILVTYRRQIEAGTASPYGKLKQFYTNRVFRIWPPYLLTVIAVVTLSRLGEIEPLSVQTMGALLTFTINLFIAFVWNQYPSHYGHLWSVAIEEQFYLWIAPVLLIVAARRVRLVCACTIVFAVVWVALSFSLGFPRKDLYVGSCINFGYMALGGLVAHVGSQPRLLTKAAPLLLSLYLLGPCIAWATATPAIHQAAFYLGPFLIASVLKSIVEDQRSVFVRLLELPPLRFLGRISYGFYLYHLLIPDLHSRFGSLAVLLDFALVFSISTLSWKLVEQPLLSLRDTLVRRERLASAQR